MGKLAVLSLLPSLRRTAPACVGHRHGHAPVSTKDTALGCKVHCVLTPAGVTCNSFNSTVLGDSWSHCASSDRLQDLCRRKTFGTCTPESGFSCDPAPPRTKNFSTQQSVKGAARNGMVHSVPLFAFLIPGKNLKSHSQGARDVVNINHGKNGKNNTTFPVRTNATHMILSVLGSGRGSQRTLTQTTGVHLTLRQPLETSSRLFSGRRHLHTHFRSLLQPPETRPAGLSPRSQSLHTLEEFSLENAEYRDYLESLVLEFDALTEARLKGDSFDQAHFHFLETVVTTVKELQSAYAELGDLRSMIAGESDTELQAMAKKDMDSTQQHIQHLEEKLVDLLVGTEPADNNDIMLEVSAGVGGQEAMLFTGEIFDMYASYAGFKGWTFDMVDHEKSDQGGLRRASALITGLDVYKHLKFEAGVHRVQRVPKTEKSGRVHTSTMTVAVLPQPSQIDISVNPKDLEIDTFRATGAGGQHVNTTDSAVRITHKPSGMVAECQQERSQIKNKEKAMKTLLSRLYQKQVEEQETALRKKRKLQVGSAGRSEKIRTYNYSQDRITDHRGPTTLHNVPQFLSGEDPLDDLIRTLMTQSRLEVLQAMVDQFLESRERQKCP